MIKKFFDVLFAILILIFSFPLLIIIAFLIRKKISKEILFIQLRPGYMGKPFKLIKFRTMHDKKDMKGKLLPDSKRLSKFGEFLRSTSLDELPSLINIIKGEMSFIGPRPLLMEYLAHYSKDEFRRHNVIPGLSGWAQINGRNLITWDEKFKYDLWYVDNRSFFLDMKIIFLTIVNVLERKGIKTKKGEMMPKFTRNKT